MSARMVIISGFFAAFSVALAWPGIWFAWPTQGAENDGPKRVALLVGVNKYNKRQLDARPLQFAERDVHELAAVLREQGFTVQTLTGPKATKANINSALADILKERMARDVIVIGFAGHGGQSPLVDGQGNPVRDEQGNALSEAYFSPVDAARGEMSSVVGLTRLLEQLDRKGGINLLLVDACRDDPDPHRGFAGNDHFGRMPGNSAILFSCSNGQQALEHEKAGGGHGVFFHHVIEGLRGAAADPETGEVGWDELVAHVRKRVNPTARALDPIGARNADELFAGELQTPHQLTNLVATPVLARRAPIANRKLSRTSPDLSKPASGSAKRENLSRAPSIDADDLAALAVKRETFLLLPTDVQSKAAIERASSTPYEAPPPGQERDDNGLQMKLCWCPPATFLMGSPKNEPGRDNDEGDENGPVSVTLTRGFWVGKFEVTQSQWHKMMGTTLRDQRDRSDPNWSLAGEGPDHPIYFVSFDEAGEFCRRFTEAERRAGRLPAGSEYRLPTEAEWEYAGRAGTSTIYSFGDDEGSLGEYAWFVGNSANSTHPVGQKRPNRWGLHDVHGNVSEWCADRFVENLSGGIDPRGPSQATASTPPRPYPGQEPGPEFGGGARAAQRVFRGGSWVDSPRGERSAVRGWALPGLRDGFIRVGFAPVSRSRLVRVIRVGFAPPSAFPDGRINGLGFRVARVQFSR
jgi:formylglycine-generating enzyme required for sulfatase activity/uncharacterized caspase-like protein